MSCPKKFNFHYSNKKILVCLFLLSFFLPLQVWAIIYSPGETLEPTCAPTAGNCGVIAPVSTTDTLSDGALLFASSSAWSLLPAGSDGQVLKMSSGELAWGNVGAAEIADDVIDFTELADALSLDAGSTITLGNNDLTFTVTGTGLTKFSRTASGQWFNFADGTDVFGLYNIAGTPESSIAGNAGSLAIDTTNGGLYVKTTDTVNTGWLALKKDIDSEIVVDVGGKGDYADISTALAAASSGDVVYVMSGSYTSSNAVSGWEVPIGVNVVGLGRPTVGFESDGGVVFTLLGNNLVEGFILDGNSYSVNGINVAGASTTIRNNVFTEIPAYPISIASGASGTMVVENNEFINDRHWNIRSSNSQEGGMKWYIRNNRVYLDSILGADVSSGGFGNSVTFIAISHAAGTSKYPTVIVEGNIVEFNVDDTGYTDPTYIFLLEGQHASDSSYKSSVLSKNNIFKVNSVVGDTVMFYQNSSGIQSVRRSGDIVSDNDKMEVTGGDTSYFWRGSTITASETKDPGSFTVIDSDFGSLSSVVNNGTLTYADKIFNSLSVGATTSASVALDVTGDIEYTGNLTDVSDERLKENIRPIDGALNKIKQLKGIFFNMIGRDSTDIGFTAQNVQTVFPEAVSVMDPKSGYLGLDYTQLIAPAIVAIQEQQNQIELLKNGLAVSSESLDDAILTGGLQIAGEVDFGKDTVGEAVIKAGDQSVAVVFDKGYAYQPIVTITADDFILGAYRVTDKSLSGFKIELSEIQNSDKKFDWHAFGLGDGAGLFGAEVKENIGPDIEDNNLGMSGDETTEASSTNSGLTQDEGSEVETPAIDSPEVNMAE